MPDAPEVKFVSTQKGINVYDTDAYYYSPIAGKGITIYVIEEGFNMTNSELRGMPGRKDWVWPKQDFWSNHYNEHYSPSDDDRVGHGTCVLSKATGVRFGIAKKADVKLVRFLGHTAAGSGQFGLLEAFARVRQDVLDNTLQGKAIINLSHGVAISDDDTRAAFKEVVADLLSIDVVIVVASGNDRV